jgi:hypothetical protein
MKVQQHDDSQVEEEPAPSLCVKDKPLHLMDDVGLGGPE